jgi:hypothetical protein
MVVTTDCGVMLLFRHGSSRGMGYGAGRHVWGLCSVCTASYVLHVTTAY